MRIGLLDIDCHAGKKKWGATVYPNIALAKIARYHHTKGNHVEWAMPIEHYDVIYRSKIFSFSPDDTTVYNCDCEMRGGTGYSLIHSLPPQIDRLQPDYTIYPNVHADTAYGFLTRGCPNHCKWCVVPAKEGAVRPYMDVKDIAIEGRTKLVLMDNNILAAGDYAVEQLEKIIHHGYGIDFNQALDARLVDDRFARLLAKCRWFEHRRIRFGCDTQAQVSECERAIRMIEGYGFKGQFFLYTMLHGSFSECYNRVMHWWQLTRDRRSEHGNPVYAYAKPYRPPNERRPVIPQWQKDLAQWVNKKMLYCTIPFEDYRPRKNFVCKEYLKIL